MVSGEGRQGSRLCQKLSGHESMQLIPIQQLGRSVSCLGIGSLYFGAASLDDTARLLDRFQAAGGNLVDTAEVYAGGHSERAIGDYLRQRGTRADWVILTKACGSPDLVRPDYVQQAIPQCLDRLQIETLDLFVLHRDDPEVPVGELVDVLSRLKTAGLFHAYGVSNWTIERIDAAIVYARSHQLPEPCLSSPHLGLATPNQPMWPQCTHATSSDLDWYAQRKLPVFGWSAQCRGFFSNDSNPDNRSRADMVRVYHSADNFEKLQRARALAKIRGVEPVQIALAWVLTQIATTVALIGPTCVELLEVALKALKITLDQKEMSWLGLHEA
jgi:1-deoxyxylulose-5-phosphate synthase